MFARKSLAWACSGALAAAALVCAASVAQAGHEVPYYPSFYPQEIRIEPLDPQAAGREFANLRDPLHLYVGSEPRFAGEQPPNLKSVTSLKAMIVVSVNPRSVRLQSREARCRAIATSASAFAAKPDLVVHRYPVTPYHADYIDHVDRVPDAKPTAEAIPQMPTVRTGALVGPNVPTHATDWDIGFDEIPPDTLVRGTAMWLAAPWHKEGWFQAYHLLRSAMSDAAAQSRADAIYQRLIDGVAPDQTAHATLERDLITALTSGCERAVVGYRLRREVHSDDFSNGVENIAIDSQSGFNSPIVLRTLKLKDLPWNGWLRLGIDARADAAWNPVAGFTDAAGRLVWGIVGDNAFLPITYNGLWAPNRTELRPDEHPPTLQSIRVPNDALTVEPGGRLVPAALGKTAMAKLIYRALASSFQDGSEMETADIIYPYALAQRWGGAAENGATSDVEIAAVTSLLRERFKGVRVLRVEETKIPIADLVFTYRSPIVEIYLDALSTDRQDNAIIAPPWSSVPWHVLALMEAAVERGIAAFSRTEAERRRLPWLDLVRDPQQREKMRALIREFAKFGYRPAALESLVSAEAATARWQAFDKFAEATGHLLVTNGPYKLRNATPEVYTFDVVRDFSYPVGLGTFDWYAYPPKALITRVEHIGNRILMTADVEIADKQQRDRKIVRSPLKRETLRETLPIRPVARYTVIAADGKLAAAGSATREPDGRFAASLPPLPPGAYRFFGAILLDGNAQEPSIGRIEFRVN